MQQHELLSKHTVDQFLGFVFHMESIGELTFRSNDARARFLSESFRLFQHDLRVGVTHERRRWLDRLKTASPY